LHEAGATGFRARKYATNFIAASRKFCASNTDNRPSGTMDETSLPERKYAHYSIILRRKLEKKSERIYDITKLRI